jgi:hypothetical protein
MTGAGTHEAALAVRQVLAAWSATTGLWKDLAAQRFEAEVVQPLQRHGEAAVQLAESLERLLDHAKRAAP